MIIQHDDKKISYSGRIDHEPDGSYFYFPASSASVRFKGSSVSVVINNKTMWGTLCLGYVIDGRQGRVPIPVRNDGNDTVYQLANSLDPEKIHTIIMYKMHAANHSFALRSFETDGKFCEPLEKPHLRLEFYGDSVSAGEVAEAVGFTGMCDPASHDSVYDNAWYSYAWQTARLLGAELHDIAQGGIAVFNGTGYFNMPNTVGMESVYDKVRYFGGEPTQWDFTKYTPHAVIFALGQNDKHNSITDSDDLNIADPEYRNKWKNGYKAIVRRIAEHYPKDTAYIFITTLLCHDPAWDKAIDELSEELSAEGLQTYRYMFARNGTATPGHPRIPEHTEMAQELSEFIRKLIG